MLYQEIYLEYFIPDNLGLWKQNSRGGSFLTTWSFVIPRHERGVTNTSVLQENTWDPKVKGSHGWICLKITYMGVHVFPILNPSPTSLPVPSLWVIPVHQPQASCILHQNWTGDSFLTWYYTCFNAILPNHPTLSLSHRVQKTVLYTYTVSLLLSRIQGCHYHLSKFHIYELVYCIF